MKKLVVLLVLLLLADLSITIFATQNATTQALATHLATHLATRHAATHLATQPKYYLEVSISKCRLCVYKLTKNGFEKIRTYRVATARKGLKKLPLGLGKITKIEINPAWHPTAYTRRYFTKKGIFLPRVIPPGHPLNYMGKFKISLSHWVPGKERVYRIHGVRPGDKKCIGKRVSGGCIRMLNRDGLELIKFISVGTPVQIAY